MRLLLGCLAFLALAATATQDSFDFHKRYGQPDVERFALRPDITMSVEYGSDGKACLLKIEPRQAAISALNFNRPIMSQEIAKELLNEVAPPETRGKPVPGGGSFQAGCGGFIVETYENVHIGTTFNACKKPMEIQEENVSFTRPVCITSKGPN
jgi:hypothetical protein